MKKTAFIFFAILAVCSITFFYSCLKKSNTSTTPVSGYTLSILFTQLRTPAQFLKVMSGRDTIVFGSKNTMLHFYTNSFRDAGNHVIAGQWIFLNLSEMYSAYDMITNNINTVAGSTILQSGGEINLTATTTTGQAVNIAPYGIGFVQPAASTQQMQLYYGTGSNPDSAISWYQGNVSNPGANALATVHDSFYVNRDSISGNDTFPVSYPLSGDMYIFDTCTNVGFTNCDFFWLNGSDTTAVTNVTVITPDTSFNNTNTEIFFYFPRYKTNILVNVYNSATHSFSLREGQLGVPIGYNYECAVVSTKNGNFYYYETTGTVTKGMTINANIAQTIYPDIQAQLKGL